MCRQEGKKERYAQQAVQNPSFMLVFTNVKIKIEISKSFLPKLNNLSKMDLKVSCLRRCVKKLDFIGKFLFFLSNFAERSKLEKGDKNENSNSWRQWCCGSGIFKGS